MVSGTTVKKKGGGAIKGIERHSTDQREEWVDGVEEALFLVRLVEENCNPTHKGESERRKRKRFKQEIRTRQREV